MADVTTRPAFLTGANAKLKILTPSGSVQVLAYVMDLSYSLDTETMPIESFGRYEIIANEPISFMCSGSFSVMRYTKALSGEIGVPATDYAQSTAAADLAFANQLDPSKVLMSTMFDIEISQQHSNAAGTALAETPYLGLYGCRITNRRATITKRGTLIDTYSFIGQLGGDLDVELANQPSRSGDTTGI